MIRRLMIFGLVALSALGAPPANAEDVRVTPVAGVSLALPKGWKTCDAATQKLLGSPAPSGTSALVCSAVVPNNPAIKLAAFGPEPDHRAMLLVKHLGPTLLTQDAIEGTTESVLADIRTSSREQWIAENPGSNWSLSSLDVRVDRLGGRHALVTSIVTMNGKGLSNVAETWDVPLDGQSYQLHFSWPRSADAQVVPALTAVRASVKFE